MQSTGDYVCTCVVVGSGVVGTVGVYVVVTCAHGDIDVMIHTLSLVWEPLTVVPSLAMM